MNDQELWERQIKVDFAKENPEKFQARQEETADTEEGSAEEGEV